MAFFIVARDHASRVELVSSECFETRDAAMSRLASLSVDPSFTYWEHELLIVDLSGASPVLLVRPLVTADTPSPAPATAEDTTSDEPPVAQATEVAPEEIASVEAEEPRPEDPETVVVTPAIGSEVEPGSVAIEWTSEPPDPELTEASTAETPDTEPFGMPTLADVEIDAAAASMDPASFSTGDPEEPVSWPWDSDVDDSADHPPADSLAGAPDESYAPRHSYKDESALSADAAAVLESLEADLADDTAFSPPLLDEEVDVETEIDQLLDDLVPDLEAETSVAEPAPVAEEISDVEMAEAAAAPDAGDVAPETTPVVEAVEAPTVIEDAADVIEEATDVIEQAAPVDAVPDTEEALSVAEPMGVGSKDAAPESAAEEIADFIFDLGSVTTIPELSAEIESKSGASGARDLDEAECENCVYEGSCPNRDQRTPSSCGSFQWKIA